MQLKKYMTNIEVYKDRIKILDSYKISSRKEMRRVLVEILRESPDCEVFYSRTFPNLIREWVAHNRLYKLGIRRSHTKNVCLEANQKWYMKILYFLISMRLYYTKHKIIRQ